MTAYTATISGSLWGKDSDGDNCPQLPLTYTMSSWTTQGAPNAPSDSYTLDCALDSTVLSQIQADSNYTVVSSAPAGS